MKTTKIHLADQSFQSEHSGNCNLLVRISKNRLSYAVADQANNQLKVLFDSPFEGGLEGLKTVIDTDPFLKYSYSKTSVAVENSNFTLIPQEIYSDDDVDSYSQFINPTDRSDILVKEIASAKVKNVYAIDTEIVDFVNRQFTSPAIFNQSNPLIETSLKLYGKPDKNTFVLQVNGGSFEALLIKNKDFRFYNLFECESSDEFNYYLLNLIKELDLTHKNTELILCGDIHKDDEYYGRIKKYFNAIEFADISRMVNGVQAFKTVPAHHFFSLISLSLCE